MIRESTIETALRTAAAQAKGRAFKVESAVVGFPDRLVLLPNAQYAFVELKAPGQKPTRVQRHWHDWLRERGYRVEVLDSVSTVVDFVEQLRG